jgi:predicted ATP-dependent endonuclease of OLD family
MVFKLANLGPLQCASIDLSELTVVCGKNNTGKTYATYAIYGFLSYWWEAYEIDLDSSIVKILLEKGSVSISLSQMVKKSQHFVDVASKKYCPIIQRVLSSEQETISKATVRVELNDSDIHPLSEYDQTTGSDRVNIFSIHKDRNKDEISISLLVDKGSIEVPSRVLNRTISFALKRIIFRNTFPEPTILVAERTGIEIFQSELDFARNRLLDTLKESEGSIDPFEILERVNTEYAIPINRAVDSVRRTKEKVKNQSFIIKEHPEIIQNLNQIIGGDVLYSKNAILFVPSNSKRVRLKLSEGSSSVRSLVDLFIYLKHVAKKGDLLMIDEPELNLHPENQRKLMQLFAQLINAGIKIYVTTHSDYIVKELNNIILMQSKPEDKQILYFQKYGYDRTYMLGRNRVSVYIASLQPVLLDGNTRRTKCNTFQKAEFNGFGFELDSFDNTINEMNEMQDSLFYGEI